MKKYILPTINCVIICALILFLNIRDNTPIFGILFAVVAIAVTLYIIKLIRNNGNEIKIKAMNKLLTLGSVILTAGCLYELITGNTISDKTGDLIALLVVIIGICIWLYDYCIKPFRNNK